MADAQRFPGDNRWKNLFRLRLGALHTIARRCTHKFAVHQCRQYNHAVSRAKIFSTQPHTRRISEYHRKTATVLYWIGIDDRPKCTCTDNKF